VRRATAWNTHSLDGGTGSDVDTLLSSVDQGGPKGVVDGAVGAVNFVHVSELCTGQWKGNYRYRYRLD